MRQDSEFDLAVVQRNQNMPLFGDERLANSAAFFRPHGDVLQVRIVRRQPARVRASDVVARVNPLGFRIDVLLQRIGIGRLEFRHVAPVEHLRRKFVALRRQILKNVGACRIVPRLELLSAGQLKLVEQDFSELLGAGDVECLARVFMYFFRERLDSLLELLRHDREVMAVDLDSVAFHFREHGNQRAFHRFVDRCHAARMQFGLEISPKPDRYVRILSGVLGRFLDLHLVE